MIILFMIILHILFWIILAGIFVYLIFRRLKIREKEDFEDRDN